MRETPLQILDRRFAAGEIDADQYRKARQLLTPGPPPSDAGASLVLPANRGGSGPALGWTYFAVTSRVIRNTFRLTITATTPVAINVVTRWLTSEPISPRSRQNMSSGISAKGIPNESTT